MFPHSTAAIWLTLLSALLLATPAPAETIQADGADYLGFEADQYDAMTGTQWKIISTTAPFTWAFGTSILPSDTNATGGTAMMADSSGVAGNLTYNLTFKTAGTYYGYLRYSLFEDSVSTTSDADTYDQEDSFCLSTAFGVNAGTADGNVIDLGKDGFTPASGGWEGTYRWERVWVRGTNPLTFDVAAGDLNTPTFFEVGSRERGSSLDYVIFGTNGALSDAELDQLMAIPEPSSMVLLAIGLLVAAGCLRKRSRTIFFAVLALGVLVASPVAAETIQADGADYLGFEAENYDAERFDTQAGSRWLAVDTTPTKTSPVGNDVLPSDTNASGGAALLDDFSGSRSVVTYNLTFKTAGTYHGYARLSMFENSATSSGYGNEDSVFISPAFGENAGTNDNENTIFDFGVPSGLQWEGTYRWKKMTYRLESGGAATLTFDVSLIDPETPWETYFELGGRENGASIDYFLFSTNGSLGDAELDQLMAIPEPSSMVLLAVGLTLAVGCFRWVPLAACQPVPTMGMQAIRGPRRHAEA